MSRVAQIEATEVRKISAISYDALIGRLKLFSQLFEVKIILQASSDRKIGGSESANARTVVQIPCSPSQETFFAPTT